MMVFFQCGYCSTDGIICATVYYATTSAFLKITIAMDIVTRLRAGRPGVGIQVETGDFSLLQSVLTDS